MGPRRKSRQHGVAEIAMQAPSPGRYVLLTCRRIWQPREFGRSRTLRRTIRSTSCQSQRPLRKDPRYGGSLGTKPLNFDSAGAFRNQLSSTIRSIRTGHCARQPSDIGVSWQLDVSGLTSGPTELPRTPYLTQNLDFLWHGFLLPT
jgi:hypothetical protein